MAPNTTPKFWFEVDGRRFGARLLTIAEQAQLQVDVERLTNGNYSTWVASNNPILANTAMLTQIAVTLNKVLVAWPTDLAAVDFLESDDVDFALKIWEEFGKSAEEFRRGVATRNSSAGVV